MVRNELSLTNEIIFYLLHLALNYGCEGWIEPFSNIVKACINLALDCLGLLGKRHSKNPCVD